MGKPSFASNCLKNLFLHFHDRCYTLRFAVISIHLRTDLHSITIALILKHGVLCCAKTWLSTFSMSPDAKNEVRQCFSSFLRIMLILFPLAAISFKTQIRLHYLHSSCVDKLDMCMYMELYVCRILMFTTSVYTWN